jgi:hypothetical protein
MPLLPAIQLLPAIYLLLSITVPGLLLLFPLDCACGDGESGGGRLVGGRLVGKVSLSEKIVLMLLAGEAGAVKDGPGFLPSRRVSSRWILG